MIEDAVVETQLGVPQGALLSPTLFNVYVDDLLHKLSASNIRLLAYADDLTMMSTGPLELRVAIKMVKDWGEQNDIKVNNSKSAILPIRADRRTPLPSFRQLLGIPVQDKYRYLGIMIDSPVTFKPQQKAIST